MRLWRRFAAGRPAASQGGSQIADACDEKAKKDGEDAQTHDWAEGHVLLALVVVVGLREETLYKDGRWELCVAHLTDGVAELPRKKPSFPRCSMTVCEAGSGLRQHPRSRQRTNNEMVSFLQ